MDIQEVRLTTQVFQKYSIFNILLSFGPGKLKFGLQPGLINQYSSIELILVDNRFKTSYSQVPNKQVLGTFEYFESMKNLDFWADLEK